jgi:hypothetical protein
LLSEMVCDSPASRAGELITRGRPANPASLLESRNKFDDAAATLGSNFRGDFLSRLWRFGPRGEPATRRMRLKVVDARRR